MPSRSKDNKKANATAGSAADAQGEKKDAVVEMRPYFEEKDRKFVLYLFYSTYLNLVPRGVKLRLISGSPVIPLVFIILAGAVIGLCLQVVNVSLGWSMTALVAFYVTLAVVLVGGLLSVLLWYVDKFDVTARVLEGLDNDLGDIEGFYRGWVQSDDENSDQRVRDESVKGQFWVLTVDDNVVGCIGVDHHDRDVIKKVKYAKSRSAYTLSSLPSNARDSDAVRDADWPRIAYVLATIDDYTRLAVVAVSEKVRNAIGLGKKPGDDDENTTTVLYRAHQEKEASIRRLAIKTEFQNHGLSTPLLKRVAFWAHSQGIEYLLAETDELQIKMAQILEKQHGYQLVSTQKVGWYGRKSLWRLDVKLWMQQEVERKNKEQEIQAQKKEDEELKPYE